MLKQTDCVFKDWHKATMYSEDKTYFPQDYPAVLDEFATSPASSLVLLHMNGRAPSKPLSKKKNVTVGDVLKWIGKYWTPVDLERALGSHPFFEGWEAAVAKGQNWTDLVSNWFGS